MDDKGCWADNVFVETLWGYISPVDYELVQKVA
jgi:hypothetical protein